MEYGPSRRGGGRGSGRTCLSWLGQEQESLHKFWFKAPSILAHLQRVDVLPHPSHPWVGTHLAVLAGDEAVGEKKRMRPGQLRTTRFGNEMD